MSVLRYIARLIPLIVSTLSLFFSLPSVGAERLAVEIEEQKSRIAALEQAYENGEIAPVDQNVFFDGDLQAELEGGIKFNELRYIATHNSYQTESVDELKELYRNLSELTFDYVSGETADFISPTVTQQLNSGIYSLELDIEVFDKDGEISFTCMHVPQIQMTTSCYDFALTLKEISMWSDNNPGHLPITIIIEPKETFLPMENMKALNVDYAKAFDSLLREGLGSKLFTPADMLRDYESFAAMRQADDWCEVRDMLGKVVVLLHEGKTTEKYIKLDKSLRSQAMFPMLRPKDERRDCASILLINDPEECKSSYIYEQNFVVRTRADNFTSVTEKRREDAFACGAQIISTDYPVKDGLTEEDYVVSFGNNKTISPDKN
ncbi:MAG: hypothetical protein IJO03_02520 [Clostridia bacterium]|nr:hypothetical protein [Clostridia bacterium]